MPTTIVGRGDESELYLLHHDRLVRAVARVVDAPAALVEDACQTAWLILLRRQPDRGPTLFGWLRTVAVHEAYRLSGEDCRHARLEELAEGGEWEAVAGEGPSLEDAVEARRALAVLAPCRRFSARIWRGRGRVRVCRDRSAGRPPPLAQQCQQAPGQGAGRIRRLEATAV